MLKCPEILRDIALCLKNLLLQYLDAWKSDSGKMRFRVLIVMDI